ncbi:hypothetical protein EXW72_08340 [Pseudomonas sp. BCA14]|uniref:hypothetical protein n=1 Tax=unclassified Pseudomonas TaxID=196821 RepID=UPI00106E3E43|nr:MULTISPECIES: hypothetical protein [unclassified Pseudomonas]TFF13723.1 hypothetical protein EXW70_04150 [Pseudomonas sp. JMN1]TFF15594.1 hypothetical protein EXW71_04890 [Pseudomonas sp. BCA17]TFF32001.1 hypothetical protein EXW72_08340 [Pseudomonas sp. BCA14]TFF32954.1 hypothetical protein EXW73_04140 [Pseudomonas sp. BCA13]
MSASNIERFDQLAGRIFADLYEAFPLPKTLSDISHGEKGLDPVFNAEFFFVATVRWLASSGYVTHGKQDNRFVFEDCVLTAKGLEVLKATPDSLTESSIGSQLQDAAKSGLVDSVKTLVGKALAIGAAKGYTAAAAWISS